MQSKQMISLIMTVYNREKYLKTAISSVIAQSFDDWELIIWDDGSSVDTPRSKDTGILKILQP